MPKKKYFIVVDDQENGNWEGKLTDENGNVVPSSEIYELASKISCLASLQAGLEAANSIQPGCLYWARGKRGVFYGVVQAVIDCEIVIILETDKLGVSKGRDPFNFYNPESLKLAKHQPIQTKGVLKDKKQTQTDADEIEVKLSSSEHGFDDFDVSNLPHVHRACVGHNIKKGDIFNVFCSDCVKLGAVWDGDIKRSLTTFASTSHLYQELSDFVGFFNDAVDGLREYYSELEDKELLTKIMGNVHVAYQETGDQQADYESVRDAVENEIKRIESTDKLHM
ncbi:MAG: hypothetical protein PHQ60_01965 [Sideroxydans sp.]|nr:hypothetical protein [Sideroxydans sp.]MDD5056608.1 hypothetical protein [Sideroxydans sp.]